MGLGGHQELHVASTVPPAAVWGHTTYTNQPSSWHPNGWVPRAVPRQLLRAYPDTALQQWRSFFPYEAHSDLQGILLHESRPACELRVRVSCQTTKCFREVNCLSAKLQLRVVVQVPLWAMIILALPSCPILPAAAGS